MPRPQFTLRALLVAMLVVGAFSWALQPIDPALLVAFVLGLSGILGVALSRMPGRKT